MELSEKTFSSQANFHLAGIIPIAGQSLDFNLPYPDSLLPIAQNYTLIEAAVIECAYAGCDTIWIVCNDDTAPILRYRIGDYIEDPMYFYNQNTITKDYRKRIPIFWTPIHPKDRDKRDCLSWSVIHGSLISLKITSQLSKWVIPDKYYVSFPYGLFDPREIWKSRKKIRSPENFYTLHVGKSVEDNLYLSFTYGKEEFIHYRRNVRKGTGRYTSKEVDDRGIPRHQLPLEERWSARFFELKDVFCGVDMSSANSLELRTFYNIGSWKEYLQFMASDYVKTIVRPKKNFFSYKEFNPIAQDLD